MCITQYMDEQIGSVSAALRLRRTMSAISLSRPFADIFVCANVPRASDSLQLLQLLPVLRKCLKQSMLHLHRMIKTCTLSTPRAQRHVPILGTRDLRST